jgi:hypothetical protein
MNGAAFRRDGNVIAESNMTRSKIDAACVDVETDGRDRQMASLVILQDYLRVI